LEKDSLKKAAAIRRERNKKTITVVSGKDIQTFVVVDNEQLQSIASASRWIGFKEQHLHQSPNVLFAWDELKNNSIYIPSNVKINDMEKLQPELVNLTKSEAEFNAVMHFKEYLGLPSIDDIKYLGSDIQLQENEDESTSLGDVDSLFQIPSLKLYILLERKTTVGMGSVSELVKQIDRTRTAFKLLLTASEYFREKYNLTAGFDVRSALYFVAGNPAVEAVLLKEGVVVIKDGTTFTY